MKFKTNKTELLEIEFNPIEPNILTMIQYFKQNPNIIIAKVKYISLKDLTRLREVF